MLVRTLDDAGQQAAADEAREVAAKLRAVVGDLRLPLLDDLGAGAALEWLVERLSLSQATPSGSSARTKLGRRRTSSSPSRSDPGGGCR